MGPNRSKLESGVAKHRAGQKPRLEQNLEAIADAEHQPAASSETLDLPHNRREARNGSRPQVIAMGEATGQDDKIVGR